METFLVLFPSPKIINKKNYKKFLVRVINKKINLGIVGTGFVSQVAHIPALLNNKKIKLLCVADKKY